MNRFILLLLLAAPAFPQENKQAPAVVDASKAGIGRSFNDSAIAAALQDAKALVVAFSGPDCPISKLYKPRLDKLSKEYAAKSVRILTVSSQDKGFVALFAPERTTEVFVLDTKAILRYRGNVMTACGAMPADNALYCPQRNTIYFDASSLTRPNAHVR